MLNDERLKTILLVEDEAIIALSEEATLEKYGYNVITVYSGEQAVAAVRTSPEIDLVLMDINLGEGLDGTQAATIILNQRDLPLIFLSSHTESEVVEKTEGITSYGYVVKRSGEVVLIASIKMAFRLFEARLKEKEKDQALRESEKRYRSLFENAPLAIFQSSLEGKVMAVNPAFASMFGYESPEEIYATVTNVADSIFADPRRRQEIVRLRAENPALTTFENLYRRKDGSTLLGRLNVRALMDADGQVASFEGYIEDITFHKQVEQTLRESEELLRAILDATPFPIALVDLQDDHIRYWSRSAHTLFGHTASTTPEWYRIAYPDPDYRREVIERWKPALDVARQSSQALNTGVYRVTCRDGSVRICELYASFLADRLIVTFNDITQRQQAEQAVRERDDQFNTLVNDMNEGVWFASVDGRDFLYANPAFEKIYGHTYAEFRANPDIWVQAAHPDDRALIEATGRQLVEQGSAAAEYRIMRDDGEIRWVFDRKKLILDPAGKPLRIGGIISDITARKLAEEALAGALREKTFLFNELQHRVQNTFVMIDALIGLELKHAAGAAEQPALAALRARIYTLANLYSILFASGIAHAIRLDSYLTEIAQSIMDSFVGSWQRVELHLELEGLKASPKSASAFGLILNELMTNALKYAFPGDQGGFVRVHLMHEDGYVVLEVANDGLPLPEGVDLDLSMGLGLKFVKMLALQLGGEAYYARSETTRFGIRADEKVLL